MTENDIAHPQEGLMMDGFGSSADADTHREAETAVVVHDSDCAVHNEPAYPNGPCDCGYLERFLGAQLAKLEAVRIRLAATVETFSPEEIKRARELRSPGVWGPDSEDNERFASGYGDTLLDVHDAYVALLGVTTALETGAVGTMDEVQRASNPSHKARETGQ